MSKEAWFDVFLVDEFGQQRAREALRVPIGVAYPDFHQVDTSAYAMTAIQSNRRCGKTEAQGVAIEARRRLAGLVPAPDADEPPERATYRIPAREVVQGMMYVNQNNRKSVPITTVEYEGYEIWLWRGTAGRGCLREEAIEVQLPGPSPRELACTCEAWEPDLDPCHHAEECPVASVPGRHGGLRLWPAPFRGKSWWWSADTEQWCCEGIGCVRAELVTSQFVAYSCGQADALLQCFYLPPVQQPERRPAPAWDPYGTDLDLAVRYG